MDGGEPEDGRHNLAIYIDFSPKHAKLRSTTLRG
jgi:hypothetical protein